MSDEFDKRILGLVGSALRIEVLGRELVVLAEGLYERAISLAISSCDRPGRIGYRAREGPVNASEEENDE